jgi:hypothetical protein
MKSITNISHVNHILRIVQPMLAVKFPIEDVVPCIISGPIIKTGYATSELGAIVSQET